ncbi:hypothetical protein OHA25_36925 [Nonomuraea sp. NBC_00507]|uniref:DNA glycosylase AlkZ-like family protein n=1 Tax=Nonomuraea sp. NBC_00507 TaxID=2976002 RepID=UPI002E191BC4
MLRGIRPARSQGRELLDGFTAATWTFATADGTATLTVHPFAPLSAPDRDALTVEGGGLLDFLAAADLAPAPGADDIACLPRAML